MEERKSRETLGKLSSEDRSLSDEAEAQKAWEPYIEARLGFRNYWYPGVFSHEIKEGQSIALHILGERILLRRSEGRVYAVQDRCAHRGVPFSVRPESYTPDTLTCWYHGWTYNLADGELCDVLTEPGCALIGKVRIKTYPTQEQKGMVFVFVGDIEPPDIRDDTPPGFLDRGFETDGIRREVKSNWRLGVENGFDSTHIYMHRNAKLIRANKLMLPLGLIPTDKQSMEARTGPGPKGVIDKFAQNYRPVFEASIRGSQVKVVSPGIYGEKILPGELSVWLPGVLKVDPFPDPSLIQFEWYVPMDEKTHMYWAVLGRRVGSEEDTSAFHAEFHALWEGIGLREGFNDDDIWAREAMERFYSEEDGWHRERLFRPDMCITEWRKLASRHNRGIQGGARS
jgi:carbazole 1,9a-dioxygenase terminal dioxygenase component